MPDVSEKKHLPPASAEMVIIGGGAAGLFCAAQWAKKAVVLESAPKTGRKLSVSGGGFANFSNIHLSPAHYLASGGFCKETLKCFGVKKIISLMREWGMPFEQRSAGQLFLETPAWRLAERMESIALANGARICVSSKAISLTPSKNGFTVQFADGSLNARKVILACGSPARQPAGWNSWNLAAELGHKVHEPRAALTPMLFAGKDKKQELLKQLAGVSVDCEITITGGEKIRKWRGPLLFTHKGISGPAVLQASLFWRKDYSLKINFLPHADFEKLLDLPENSSKTPLALLRRYLPERLCETILPPDTGRRKIAEISRKNRRNLGECVNIFCPGKVALAGLDKAEVCAGGVDTDEICPETMESRLHPGLYVLGEMLDVTGELGGYNLHWAFASAFMAGRAFGRL